MNSPAFGTIEAIVATALFCLVAAGATSTLVFARRLQTDIAAERRATQAAIASLERLRAGSIPTTTSEAGLTTIETLQAWDGYPQAFEARVQVVWADGSRSIELKTLLRR